jgi:hypothetical protein
VQNGGGAKASNPDVIDLTELEGSEMRRREVTVLQNCVHTKITSIMNDQVAQQACVDSLRASLTQASDLAEKFCPTPDDDNQHWKCVCKLINRLDEAEEAMSELNIEAFRMKRRAFFGLDTYIESASKAHCKRALSDIGNTGGVLHGKKIKLESAPILKAAPASSSAAAAASSLAVAAAAAAEPNLTTPKSTALYNLFASDDEATTFSTPAAVGKGYASSPEY